MPSSYSDTIIRSRFMTDADRLIAIHKHNTLLYAVGRKKPPIKVENWKLSNSAATTAIFSFVDFACYSSLD